MAIEEEQHDQQHDDRHVECARPPFVWVVGFEEAANAQHVEHDRDRADDDANDSAGARCDTEQRRNEREDHVREDAADPRDDDGL